MSDSIETFDYAQVVELEGNLVKELISLKNY